MKITKRQLKRIIKEELSKVLNENAGGYYIKRGNYGSISFHDPEGNELPDPDDDDWGLGASSVVAATEDLPGFEKYMDRGALEMGKKEIQAVSISQKYPDADVMDDYFLAGPDEGWKGLFQLYLQKAGKKDAQVVEAPEEVPEDDEDLSFKVSIDDDDWGWDN